MSIRRFEDIEGWKLARTLTREIYAVSNNARFSRDWGLRDQITRAASSSMHNIAEGCDAGSHLEFARFLGYAQRSCSEVQSELYVALDQGYISGTEFENLYGMATRTRSKIGAFIKYLRKVPE